MYKSGLFSAHFYDLFCRCEGLGRVSLTLGLGGDSIIVFFTPLSIIHVISNICRGYWKIFSLNHFIVGDSVEIFCRKKCNINGKILTWIQTLFVIECNKMVLEHYNILSTNLWIEYIYETYMESIYVELVCDTSENKKQFGIHGCFYCSWIV